MNAWNNPGVCSVLDVYKRQERIIRRLMEAVKGYRCVIGFQLDNETKHFGTSSENVQQMFVRYIRKKYDGDLERFNHDFGLEMCIRDRD